MRWMFGALVALFCVARVGPADAGCPSTCKGALGDVKVDPTLECANIKASLNTCECRVLVSLDNECAGPIEVRSEDVVCSAGDDCFSLAVGEAGSFKLPIRSTGSKQWSLPLQEGESGAHTLDLSVSVSEYDANPGCAVGAAGYHSTNGSWWVGLLLGLSALRRRAARAGATP